MNIHTLCLKAARLIKCGKIREVINALEYFNVRAVIHLQPEQFSDFADKLDLITE